MKHLSSLIAGIIFGLGLAVSGMVNPAKVQNFLDVFGTWDPSLAFVMGGAIAVTMPGYWLLQKSTQPLFAKKFQFPTRTDLDAKLLTGAAIFGAGWGMSGFCPGPALTAVPMAAQGTLVFVVTMLIGIWLSNMASSKNSTMAGADI